MSEITENKAIGKPTELARYLCASPSDTESSVPNYHYGVYGIYLRSDIALPLPECSGDSLADVHLQTASTDWFARQIQDAEISKPSPWYRYSRLEDGSSYVGWQDVGEFLVSSNGKSIVCCQSNNASIESFQVYLLGQALSFALVHLGFEPLHATAIVVNGEAVAFLGDEGFGKSTLAACFLAAGHRILTDDLLILRETPRGIRAHAGPARIKLFPRVAQRYVGNAASGVTMNSITKKLILPLNSSKCCVKPVPLRGIYSIGAPSIASRKKAICIEPLSPREEFMELIKNTFNYRILDGARLARQFTATERLVAGATVRRLSYPRTLDQLSAVRDAILADLLRESTEECLQVRRMSGIAGILHLDGAPVERSLFCGMTEFLTFRGPDAQAIWSDGHIGFVHTLLRTTDESDYERQPFTLDGNIWIVADARVDAQNDLIRKLTAHGHNVAGQWTDVELILRAYQSGGKNVLSIC